MLIISYLIIWDFKVVFESLLLDMNFQSFSYVMGLYLFLCFLVLSGSLSFLGWFLWFFLIISYVIFWVLNALV